MLIKYTVSIRSVASLHDEPSTDSDIQLPSCVQLQHTLQGCMKFVSLLSLLVQCTCSIAEANQTSPHSVVICSKEDSFFEDKLQSHFGFTCNENQLQHL